jgi:tRNA modification GTPase
VSLSDDTIAAPITAPGQAGVAIVRVSGKKTRHILSAVSPIAAKIISAPRSLQYSAICSADAADATPAVLDHGLLTFFPEPRSFTGEDCLEINLHGSPFLVTQLMQVLTRHGARLARPGEFTERAFLNGKIDLCQAEAIADMIAAETELQAKVAREQLEGKLSQAVSDLGEPLRNLLAEIEASIDFPDEDISPLQYSQWSGVVSAVAGTVDGYLQSFSQGRLCREGALVVLAGLPNAGKSSLLNQLLGEDRAIVTDIPGTTRDSIEERSSLGGLCVRFCDTAGLLDSSSARSADPVEILGVERSWKKLKQADLVVYVVDAAESATSSQQRPFFQIRESAPKLLVVANKSDIAPDGFAAVNNAFQAADRTLAVSAKTGAGLTELRQRIVGELLSGAAPAASLVISNQRHFEALRGSRQALTAALDALKNQTPSEFVAADIRAALHGLEEIIGSTPTEDILGRIFSKFCIGK